MSRIFITGDVHGDVDINRLISPKYFKMSNKLTREDYVVILGDFGCVWDMGQLDQTLLHQLEEMPFTTLFIDGNHENFNLLNSFPVQEWHGGKTHLILPHIRHLMRGQIFNIGDKTFFTMGGATSTDKYRRQENVSWWPQEMPSYDEMLEGVDNLAASNNKVDYILTHTGPNSIIDQISFMCDHDSLTNYLEKNIKQEVEFKKWFFGHWHRTRTFENEKFILLYDMCFVELLDDEQIKWWPAWR